MIWRTKKALGDGATVAEIGRDAGLASTKLWGAGDATTTALTANTVYRALSDADELIRNVGEGRFPDKRTTAEQEREAEAAIVATAATMAAATGVGATPLG